MSFDKLKEEIEPLLDNDSIYHQIEPTGGLSHPPNKPTTTKFVFLLGGCAAISGFLFGYDTGVVSGAMLFIPDALDLDYAQSELVVSVPGIPFIIKLYSSLMLGFCAIFALIAGPFNDYFGRKVTIMTAAFAFTLGAVVLATSFTFWQLLIGRAIVGAAVGFASMTCPPYIAECCPYHIRGVMIMCFQMMITFGQFVASVFGGLFSMPWANPKLVGWRLMLGISGIPSLIQFILFFFLPESPRWLVEHGRKEEAQEVLNLMYKSKDKEWRSYEMREIQTQHDTIQNERVEQGIENEWPIVSVLKAPHVRRALFLGCSLQAFQQFAGINTIMYYAATIIQMSGVRNKNTAAWLNAAVAGVNFSFTMIPLFLIQRWGRRSILLMSNAGVVVTLSLMGLLFILIRDTSPSVAHKLPLNTTNITGDLLHTAKQCAAKTLCDDCVTFEECGFCYAKDHNSSSSYGTCLPVLLGKTDHSELGACTNATALASDQSAYVWAWNYCESSWSWTVMVGMLIYLVTFTSGMGPMPWVINAEIYPNWARSTGVALATFSNWTINLIISQTFLDLTELLHKYGAFFLYAAISTVGLMLFYFITPETKDLQIDEVENLFKRPSDRRPSTYVNNDNNTVLHKANDNELPRKYSQFETEF